jgi:hypothetical protein
MMNPGMHAQPNGDDTANIPASPARAACSQRGCVYPAIEAGLCRGHLRDRISEASPVGCCAGQMLGYAPYAVADTPAPAKKTYCCRTLAQRAPVTQKVGERKRGSFGSKNGLAKLDEATVVRMRAEAETQSGKSLALKYSVDPSTVGKILHRRIWKHV